MTTIEKPEGTSLYLQMARKIEQRIASGDLQAGERLPSFGQMRKDYGANQVTMERVYAVLDKKGLIRREAKRGIFVAEPKPKARPVIEVVTRFNLQFHEYYAHMLEGVQEEAYSRGAEIVLCRDDDFLEWDRVDAIVLLPGTKEAMNAVRTFAPDKPCVMTGSRYPLDIPSITVDVQEGIAASVRHLVALGHRRIGYISGEARRNEYAPPPDRLDAFQQALQEAGVEPDPRLIWPLRWSMKDPLRDFVEMGREKMELWLKSGWTELGCTAILAQNDETAIGMVHALEDAGYRVPQDVSVLGFDGLVMGNRLRPRLTTVKVPLVEIGRATIASVMRCIEERAASAGQDKSLVKPASMLVPPQLIERDSTAPPPRCGGTEVEHDCGTFRDLELALNQGQGET